MKKIFLTLALAVLSSTGLFAQLTEGSVSYKMDFEADDPEMEMAIAMMAGSELKLFFKEDMTRADVKMGSMMNMVTVSDSKSENVLMLMDISMMGMKYGVKSTLTELEKQNDGKEPEMDIRLEDKKKEILGYDCKLAVATDDEGNEVMFWYTEDISVNKRGQSYLNEDIPGFPLEYEIMQGGMKISLLADSFEEKIDKKAVKELFSMEIPEGYEEKTLDDLMNMGGGM